MLRLISCLAALWTGTALAAQPVEVDLELALMVDVSRSMSPYELEVQRRGYASALRSDMVMDAVRSGPLQRIALTYVEWAGTQQVVVDWRLIETQDDLDAFADDLSVVFNPSLRRTSISEALVYAAHLLKTNDFNGWRQVIDVSGDGPNNQGGPVTRARDDVLAEGIVINGLPLMTRDGMGSYWHLEDLDLYYRSCVIGGYGAFAIPVLTWEDFADAVLRKLVLEIAAPQMRSTVVPVQMRTGEPYDCLIGEKMWRQRQQIWGEP